jgi:adenosylcobinamide-GDP ribazoletransferase
MAAWFKKLRIAIQFLTILPTHLTETPKPEDIGQAAVWFPLVGLALGGILYGVGWVLQFILPPLAAAVIVLALWVYLTGGLHLDGLADCCDALFVAATPQRRLEIMRDPHHGTVGVVGLILHLLFKGSLLVLLMPFSPVPVLLSPALARWLLLLAARQPQARPHGLGANFALGLSPRMIWAAIPLPLLLIILGGVQALLATGLAFLALVSVLRLARSRLGGVTGDVLGMTVEVTELAVLLGFVVYF